MGNVATVEHESYIGKGIYTVHRAAFVVRSKPAAVRRWVHGYRRKGVGYGPIISSDFALIQGEVSLSFLDLVEVRFIERFRREGVSGHKLREAQESLRMAYGVRHPFAWANLRTDGRDIFIEILEDGGEKVIQASGRHRSSYVFPEVIEPFFRNIVFSAETHLAKQVYPFGKDGGVVIDPVISFGEPVLTGTRIPTHALTGFLEAGNDAATVARWYDISLEDVERARAFEAGQEWAA